MQMLHGIYLEVLASVELAHQVGGPRVTTAKDGSVGLLLRRPAGVGHPTDGMDLMHYTPSMLAQIVCEETIQQNARLLYGIDAAKDRRGYAQWKAKVQDLYASRANGGKLTA